MLGFFFALTLISAVKVQAALTGSNYGSTFVGCFNTLPSGSVSIATQSSAATCAFILDKELTNDAQTACYSASTSYEYAYYASANSTCACSASGYPTYGYMTSGNDGGCAGYQGMDTHTTFSPSYTSLCFTNGAAGLSLSVYSFSTDPQSCFAKCATYTYAYFLQPPTNPSNSPSGYYCYCSNTDTVTKTRANTCSAGELFFYSHSAVAASAGLTRRKFEMKREKDKTHSMLCPKGRTACNLVGDRHSFECLDVSSELESCGGCLYGEYGSSNSTLGTDCSAGGVALGHSTCTQGECVITGCKKGFQLVEGSRCRRRGYAS